MDFDPKRDYQLGTQRPDQFRTISCSPSTRHSARARATAAQLEEWAALLGVHGADRTALFVREAAGVYAERGLLADA